MLDAVTYVQTFRVGLHLHTEDDGTVSLRAYPTHRLTTRLRSFIRDHKAEIMELLQTPTLERTVGNMLAFDPDELDELRAEIAAEDPADPWHAHNVDALQRAEAIIAQRHASAAAIRLEKAS
ncbi:MAG TPA: hypothetical protein VNZ58_07235 [Thermomicrobiales bacterium]|nr:hypothetical protein [Thermomicrobiales bacterium]